MSLTAPKPRRCRLLAFGLRGLMLSVLVAGGGVGWFVHRAGDQHETVEQIGHAHGKTAYNFTYLGGKDYDGHPLPSYKAPPAWLGKALGPDYFGVVTHVLFLNEAGPARPNLADDALMARIGRLEHLVVLQLPGNPGVTGAGFSRVRGLTRLMVLNLDGTSVDGPSLVHLRRMTDLQELTLPGDVSDADLGHIAGLTGLWRLTLNGPKITDAGLAHLAGLTSLNDLVINSPGVKGPGLAHLRGMTKIDALILNRSGVTGLAALPTLPRLRFVSLERRPISAADLARLAALPKLNQIGLKDCPVGDLGILMLVARRRKLEYLDLSGTRTGDAGLALLALCPILNTLQLARTEVTDAGLARFAWLRSLRLTWVMVARARGRARDAALIQLRRGRWPQFFGLDPFETLDLSGTKITDAALPTLRSMTRVTRLNLEGSTITPAGLAAFKASLTPDREVDP